MSARTAKISRKTNETDISVSVDLDGTGKNTIETGVGFFDHMLEQLSRHSLIDMNVSAKAIFTLTITTRLKIAALRLVKRSIRRWVSAAALHAMLHWI